MSTTVTPCHVTYCDITGPLPLLSGTVCRPAPFYRDDLARFHRLHSNRNSLRRRASGNKFSDKIA